MSSKSILIFSSYAVSKLVRFLRCGVCDNYCFQKLHADLSSDRRVADLVERVNQLSLDTDSEESEVLRRRVDTLDRQWTDTVDQCDDRRQALDNVLNDWTLFDTSYQQLLSTYSALHSSIDDTSSLTAQDAIVHIETVSD